jgi:HD-GYP domain-containing protein (c-di-GMP phosphodiesterase class II)
VRVAGIADALAGRLGVGPARRRWLRRGALLHDVGKLGVSNAILDKPGPLDDDEWLCMRRHAAHTEAILGRIGAFAELARVAGAHHERLDGTGYPRGLAGGQIALETRIITTADVFDAISADRPYRAAVPIAQTIETMRAMVGSALDARCFAALEEIVGRR